MMKLHADLARQDSFVNARFQNLMLETFDIDFEQIDPGMSVGSHFIGDRRARDGHFTESARRIVRLSVEKRVLIPLLRLKPHGGRRSTEPERLVMQFSLMGYGLSDGGLPGGRRIKNLYVASEPVDERELKTDVLSDSSTVDDSSFRQISSEQSPAASLSQRNFIWNALAEETIELAPQVDTPLFGNYSFVRCAKHELLN